MTSPSLAEISPKFLSFFSSGLVMDEAVQSHWGSLAPASDLRAAVDALAPVVPAAVPEDPVVLFLPTMLKEFLEAVAMAR
jgi:hypothetical protein